MYKRANLPIALFCLFFLRHKYLILAINHYMALSLESEKYKIKFENGTYPPEDWETDALKIARAGAKGLRKRIIFSLYTIIVCSIVALFIGLFTRAIDFSLGLNSSKTIAFLGTFFVSWATLIVLGNKLDTWGGETLHELLSPFVFKVLFIPGVFLLFTSVVI